MECLPKEEIGQGSIVIIPFPFLDKPESKVRPALVVSNSKFNSTTDNLIVVPITSSMKDMPYSTVISKDDIAEGELLATSRIRIDKMFSLNRDLVKFCVAKLHSSSFETINQIIQESLEMDISD
jgi:mRNA interferase MazF